MKRVTSLIFALTSIASLAVNAAPISIAGITFDDSAIANQVTGSNGSFLNWNPAFDSTGVPTSQLIQDMTDTSPGSYAFSFDTGAYIDMAFTNTNVYNGAGADIALFFVGSGGHTGNLTSLDVSGSVAFSNLIYTGYSFNEIWDSNGDGNVDGNDLSPIYVSYLDLDAYGIDDQTALNNFRLEIGGASAVPSLMAAINTTPGMTPVPLPAPFILLISGLAALGVIGRRK